jgi:hypothetical protein
MDVIIAKGVVGRPRRGAGYEHGTGASGWVGVVELRPADDGGGSAMAGV